MKNVQHQSLKKIILIAFCIHSYKLSANDLYVEPVLTQSFGSTKFRLQVVEPIANPTNTEFTDSVGQSELEYPLDVAIAGLKLTKRIKPNKQHNVNVNFYVWHNLNNPDNKMQDTDWFGAKNNNITSLYKFSYTQSRSEMKWLGFEFGLEIDNYTFLNKATSYGFSIQADYSYHRMFGVQGWQKTPTSERVEFNEFKNTLVLTYKLWHIQPDVYINLNVLNKSNLKWDLLASFSPMVIAKDKDDHVLRKKDSETTAVGFGLGLKNQLAYLYSKNITIAAELNIRYFRTEGKMRQEFYGDDPGTTENETGLVFNNISNVISMFTQQISISARYEIP